MPYENISDPDSDPKITTQSDLDLKKMVSNPLAVNAIFFL
jgi:hypothetical protein